MKDILAWGKRGLSPISLTENRAWPSWHSVKRKNLWKGAKPFLPLQGEGQDGDGVKI